MSVVRKKISEIHHRRPSGPIGFGIVTYRIGGTYGPVRQTDYQLVVAHTGSFSFQADGQKRQVRKGQGILLEPGPEEFFRFSKSGETTHSWCRFPAELCAPPFIFPAGVFRRPARCSPWLLALMRRGWKLPGEIETPEGRRMMLGMVLAAMWDFCRAFSESADARGPLPAPLAQALRAMEARLAEPLSLGELASLAAVSKSRLIKLAHDHWKTTPMEKFWQLRLDEAARLLRETGLGIGEVAYRTGFANPYHFSRRFRQRFERHPRAWRNAIWGR
jgi:AraC family transcriptional regulator